MNPILAEAQRIIQSVARHADHPEGRRSIEAIELHAHGYAEPGYDNPLSGVIAFGNWNRVTQFVSGKFVTLDDSISRVARHLEKIGVELQGCDEWAKCDRCGKLVRTQPDSHGWKPSYHLDDDGLTCLGCLQASAADHLERNTVSSIDPAEHGYVRVQDDFEHGFHDGQNADPQVIAAALETQGIRRYLFSLDSTGQFGVRFSVYVHESEVGQLNCERFDAAETNGPSVASAARLALEDAARKMDALPPDGIKWATVKPDGPADVRLISPDDLVNGQS